MSLSPKFVLEIKVFRVCRTNVRQALIQEQTINFVNETTLRAYLKIALSVMLSKRSGVETSP